MTIITMPSTRRSAKNQPRPTREKESAKGSAVAGAASGDKQVSAALLPGPNGKGGSAVLADANDGQDCRQLANVHPQIAEKATHSDVVKQWKHNNPFTGLFCPIINSFVGDVWMAESNLATERQKLTNCIKISDTKKAQVETNAKQIKEHETQYEIVLAQEERKRKETDVLGLQFCDATSVILDPNVHSLAPKKCNAYDKRSTAIEKLAPLTGQLKTDQYKSGQLYLKLQSLQDTRVAVEKEYEAANDDVKKQVERVQDAEQVVTHLRSIQAEKRQAEEKAKFRREQEKRLIAEQRSWEDMCMQHKYELQNLQCGSLVPQDPASGDDAGKLLQLPEGGQKRKGDIVGHDVQSPEGGQKRRRL